MFVGCGDGANIFSIYVDPRISNTVSLRVAVASCLLNLSKKLQTFMQFVNLSLLRVYVVYFLLNWPKLNHTKSPREPARAVL